MKKLLILLSLLVIALFVVSCAPKEGAEGKEGALAGQAIKIGKVVGIDKEFPSFKTGAGSELTIKSIVEVGTSFSSTGYGVVMVSADCLEATKKYKKNFFRLSGTCLATPHGGDVVFYGSSSLYGIMVTTNSSFPRDYTCTYYVPKESKGIAMTFHATAMCASSE